MAFVELWAYDVTNTRPVRLIATSEGRLKLDIPDPVSPFKNDIRLAKGTLGTTVTTLYTVPASTKTVVKSLSLTNRATSDVMVEITFAGCYVIPLFVLIARSLIFLSPLNHVLHAGDLISGCASVANSVDYYVTGEEIT